MNIRIEVNAEFLDAAEKQILEILLEQRLSFNDRWWGKPIIVKFKPILRMLGLVLSLFAVAICVVMLILGESWASARLGPELLLLIFLIFALFFYFLPSIEQQVKRWTRQSSLEDSKKLAAKSIKDARKLVPYTAEYDLKGGAVSYYREKGGELKFVWTRKLKGIAIQSEFATVVFRKWASFVPMIILLHKDSGAAGEALHEQKIDCRLYDKSPIDERRSSTTSA